MKHESFTAGVAAVILASMAVVAGCGGGDNKAAAPTAPTVTPPAVRPLQFNPPEQLRATKGTSYAFSFCQPALANSGAPCPEGATNPTGGHAPYHFDLDTSGGFPPMGLVLSLNGILSGTPTTVGKGTTFSVCAADLDQTRVCRKVTMDVNEPLQFNAPAQLVATKGKSFSYSFCQPAPASGAPCPDGATNPTGGHGPYQFQLATAAAAGNSPPTGLTLAANGTLSGTPTVAGQNSFTVCAVDSDQMRACKTVAMVVNDVMTGLTFHTTCTTRTSPFYSMTCTGTADFVLNVAVPSGVVVVVYPYGNSGSEFHGWANVSTASGGPGPVHIANFTMTTTGPCLTDFTTTFQVWGGTLDTNPPLLASQSVRATAPCS